MFLFEIKSRIKCRIEDFSLIGPNTQITNELFSSSLSEFFSHRDNTCDNLCVTIIIAIIMLGFNDTYINYVRMNAFDAIIKRVLTLTSSE
jgi:hypothetical protein